MNTPKNPPKAPTQIIVTDERDDSEMVRAWLAKYGRSLLQGVTLGLVIAVGWQYYGQYQANQALNASVQFDELMRHIRNQDDDRIGSLANRLMENYGNTAYASLTDLLVARQAVLSEDYAAAERHLRRVIEQNIDPVLVSLAQLRLAQIEMAREQFEMALERLSAVRGEVFQPLVMALRGDIYFAKGDFGAAQIAYEIANPFESTPPPSMAARRDAVISRQAIAEWTMAAHRLPAIPQETPVTTIDIPEDADLIGEASSLREMTPFWSPEGWLATSDGATEISVVEVDRESETAPEVVELAESETAPEVVEPTEPAMETSAPSTEVPSP